MSADVLHFTCPSCQTGLTVPVAMAGVTGPCPRCSVTIRAPLPPGPEPRLEIAPVMPAASPAAEPSSIRPLPRALPEGRNPPRISPKQSTASQALRRRPPVERRHRGAGSRSRGWNRTFPRIAVPVLVGLALGLVVAVICYQFLPTGTFSGMRGAPSPPVYRQMSSTPIDRLSQPDDAIPAPRSADQFSTPESIAAGIDSPPDQPSADRTAELAARAALDQFLNASKLEQRVGLIEPPLPPEELEGTILTGPMPPVSSITPATPIHNELEGLTVRPFRVEFQTPDDSPSEFIIHLRCRTGCEPKIAVEPFLDLVGGRLAAFANAAVPGQRTFHAIIEAVPRCFEEGIPNPERKFTYRLSGSDSGQEIARAYASLTTSLAEDLYSPTSEIRWGMRKEAIVVLRWNSEEDPEQPFIQLDTIVSPDWNP